MEIKKNKAKFHWIKWTASSAIAAATLVITLKFLFPPAVAPYGGPENGKSENGNLLNRPISYFIRPGIPAAKGWRGGRLNLRIENGGHTGVVTDLRFTDNGRILLSASLDGTVRIWDVGGKDRPVLVSTIHGLLDSPGSTASSLEETQGRFGRIHAIALSPDSAYLAAAAASRIRLYSLRRGELIRIIKVHKGEITDLAFSPDGKSLASAAVDGMVKILDFANIRSADEKNLNDFFINARNVQELEIGGGPVRAVDFSADFLAAVSADGSLHLFDRWRQFRLAHALSDPSLDFSCAVFSHDGKQLLAGCRSRRLIRISLPSGTIGDLARLVDVPDSLCLAPDGQQLLVSGSDEAGNGSLRVYSIRDGSEIREFDNRKRPQTAVAATATSEGLLWASADALTHEIVLWNGTGGVRVTIPPGAALVSNVLLSPNAVLGLGMAGSVKDKVQFAAVSRSFDTKKLSLCPLSPLEPMNGAIQTVGQFSIVPLGEARFAIPFCGSLDILGIMRDEKVLGRIISGPLNGRSRRLATFVGKSMLVCGGADGHLLVYNLKGDALARLNGPEGDILSLAGSPSTPYIAAAAADHTVRLWNLSRLQNIAIREESPSGDIATFVNSASSVLCQIGYPESIRETMQKEMADLSLNDPDNWPALGQYLRLLGSDVKAIEPELSLVVFRENEWLAWIPQGYAGANSPDVLKYFGYLANTGDPSDRNEPTCFISGTRVFDTMFRPDLIKLALNAPENFNEFSKANRGQTHESLVESLVMNPPPEISIIAPTSGQLFKGTSTLVRLKIKDTGGGIGDIRIFNNGKLVSSEGVFRAVKTDTAADEASFGEKQGVLRGSENLSGNGDREKAVSIPLVPGKNQISCAVFNYRNSVQSALVYREVFSPPSDRKPRLFCLAVGVNNFQNPQLGLVYTHADALSISELLKSNGNRFFRQVIVKTLLDATKDKLVASFNDWQPQIEPTDTFVFYASSHGALEGDRFFLVTADADGGELNETNSLSADELLEFTTRIPAQRQVIILDTCQSGSSGWAFNDIYQTRLQAFSFDSGMQLLAASSPYETASEGYNQHGLYSYFLIKGLEGEADLEGNRDGRISAGEVSRYAREKVKNISQSLQLPVFSEYGRDIILIDRGRDGN